MSTLHGNFYFRRTSNGNLIGEYSNDKSDGVYSESADADNIIDGFEGTYHSSWQEGGKAYYAYLSIEKTIKDSSIYLLNWDRGHGKGFSGRAMLTDGMLIGNYTDL